jgi:hypothetical protein
LIVGVIGCGLGAGAAALLVEVEVGREEEAEAVVEANVTPESSATRFRAGCLPEKNSAAVTEGSIEGAGGKMSAWKESA